MTSPGPQPPGDGGRPPPGGRPEHPGSDAGDLPLVYNPYGGVAYPSTYPVPPAGLGPETPARPVRRPAAVHVALVLHLLAALPYLLPGLLLTLAPEQLAAAVEAQREQFRAQGVDLPPAAELGQILRVAGILMLVIALVFAVLAVLAWSGRRWARALVAALTVGFALMVALAVVGAAGQGTAVDAASLIVIVGPTVLAAVGVVLLFGRSARAWFDRR